MIYFFIPLQRCELCPLKDGALKKTDSAGKMFLYWLPLLYSHNKVVRGWGYSGIRIQESVHLMTFIVSFCLCHISVTVKYSLLNQHMLIILIEKKSMHKNHISFLALLGPKRSGWAIVTSRCPLFVVYQHFLINIFFKTIHNTSLVLVLEVIVWQRINILALMIGYGWILRKLL